MSLDREWMTDARCAEVDPERFFPKVGDNAQGAKDICAGCPVAYQCLEYAIANEFEDGIWGGLTPNERRKLTERKPAKRDRYIDRIKALHAEKLNDTQIGEVLDLPRASVKKWRSEAGLPSNWRAS